LEGRWLYSRSAWPSGASILRVAEPQTQPTQPKGKDKDGKPYEPVEIPVPTEGDVMDLFEKVAHAPAEAGEKKPYT
jgi:hypothetical protein